MSIKYTVFTYNCDECGKYVINDLNRYQCSHCKINLCKKCYKKKYHHVCSSCYNNLSNSYMWIIKMLKDMLIIVPLLVLFLPIPIPSIILLFNPKDNAFSIILLLISLGVSFLLLYSAKNIIIRRGILEMEKKPRDEVEKNIEILDKEIKANNIEDKLAEYKNGQFNLNPIEKILLNKVQNLNNRESTEKSEIENKGAQI